jgi:hypothetical protein
MYDVYAKKNDEGQSVIEELNAVINRIGALEAQLVSVLHIFHALNQESSSGADL